MLAVTAGPFSHKGLTPVPDVTNLKTPPSVLANTQSVHHVPCAADTSKPPYKNRCDTL